MPCSLAPSTTGRERFTATAGSIVTLTLKSPAGVNATLLHIRYGKGAIDATPPLQFTVAKGRRILVVLAEASKPGALLQLVEECEEGEQVVDAFHFDPFGPARGYLVLGV